MVANVADSPASLVISLVALFISVLAWVVNLLESRRESRREKLFPITLQLLEEFRSDEFKHGLTTLRESAQPPSPRRGESLPAAITELEARNRQLAGYFNNVGVLVAEGVVNRYLVAAVMRKSVLDAWEKLRPAIYAIRDSRADELGSVLYAHFEHLAVEMKRTSLSKVRQRLHLKSDEDPLS